ncbi:hypothetical protein Pmani_019350 [Petrolisthes manimaculis]|uniref:Uncharacterized protein n=1 Tax=Petrolisthes manimaculis TaxID=1843537 RepID=A0AAE1U5S8_9EUCA|nr:hypothetical protein Pmani_019350 [Petrolisthes manimaculis]
MSAASVPLLRPLSHHNNTTSSHPLTPQATPRPHTLSQPQHHVLTTLPFPTTPSHHNTTTRTHNPTIPYHTLSPQHHVITTLPFLTTPSHHNTTPRPHNPTIPTTPLQLFPTIMLHPKLTNI